MVFPQQEGLVLPVLAVPSHPILNLVGESSPHQRIGMLVEGAVSHLPVALFAIFGIPYHGGPVRDATVSMSTTSVVLPSILQHRRATLNVAGYTFL